ncbi:MAG TPA: PorP/SprF family type IX secretion system membrane protein, partial [Bacteroidia bacterium]|nr:PorP/SprF family type IX secretion system membrane protein [Bacteroidia bacterium]
MKKLLLIIATGTMFSDLTLNAQDVHFSQVTETPLLLNPAQAGFAHDILAIANYKDQWKAVSSVPYRTFNVSADVAFLKKPSGSHMGVGLDVYDDKAGDGNMSTATGQIDLSGSIAADDHNMFGAGLYAGFGQRGLQMDKLMFDNQYDGMHYNSSLPTMEPTNVSNFSYFDLGAGIAWFYGQGHATISSNDARIFNIGFSMQHLNRPVYSYYADGNQRLPMRFVANGNAEIGIKNYSLVLEPSYNVFIQAGHHEIYTGVMVKYITQEASHFTGRKKSSGVVLGAYWRYKDAICPAARLEMSNYSIGIS